MTPHRRQITVEPFGDQLWNITKSQIRLKGQWLLAAGFEPGTHVQVHVSKYAIHITPASFGMGCGALEADRLDIMRRLDALLSKEAA